MNEPLFIQLYLRGGADALSILCPYQDQNYKDFRSYTQILDPADPAPGAMDPEFGNDVAIHLIDANAAMNSPNFGIPQAMDRIQGPHGQNKVAWVHAIGVKDPTRSHFVQQNNMEVGETGDTASKKGLGWLARYLNKNAAFTPGTPNSVRAISMTATPPDTFNGGVVTSAPDPGNFGHPGDPSDPATDARAAAILSMHTIQGKPLADILVDDYAAIEKFDTIPWDQAPDPVADPLYPNNSALADSFKRAAILAEHSRGTEIVAINLDNVAGGRWDSHADQGVFGNGTMATLMKHLSQTLEAFLIDVEKANRQVRILVMTEFGRTVQENSAKGTDHGRGGLAMIVGDDVNGGIYTNWPGLDQTVPDPDNPDADADLICAVDIRDLQVELMTRHFNADWTEVIEASDYVLTDWNTLA